MKIFFGGTFDPVHNGHISLALHIQQEFNHVVSLLPLSGVPNYKLPPKATLQQRLAMLEIIVSKYPRALEIDYSEANLNRYSPTCETLARMRELCGAELGIYFIIGSDSLLSLDTWDNWQQLFSLTNFIVALRPDYPLENMSPRISKFVTPRLRYKFNYNKPSGEVILINWIPINISSTEIRHRTALGQKIDDLVPLEISNYIRKHNLYLEK